MKSFFPVPLLALLCLIILAPATRADVKRVLFIGNSYTGVNNLPQTVQSLALSLGDTLVVDNNAPGGYTFNNHSTNATTMAKIQAGNWDFVVLQEQSQIPAFSPAQVATDCYPYARKLCDSIRFYNPCAEVLFYMTWGRKNGDAGNCASYPPVCTYAGMQQRLRESYLEMADSNNMSCAPVGAAWNVCRTNFPGIELYQADESHPSMNGTYLAACTFYSSMYRQSCVGASYLPAGVSNADALTLQTTASQVVLDSLENWQQHGNIPFAGFSHLVAGNSVSFSNQSLRYTSVSWDFGDGSAPSQQVSPVHAYTTTGSFQVELMVYKDSCLSDVVTDTVVVSGVPTGVTEMTRTSPAVWSDGQSVFCRVQNTGIRLSLYDVAGRLIQTRSLDPGEQRVNLPAISTGILFYILRDAAGEQRERGSLMLRP